MQPAFLNLPSAGRSLIESLTSSRSKSPRCVQSFPTRLRPRSCSAPRTRAATPADGAPDIDASSHESKQTEQASSQPRERELALSSLPQVRLLEPPQQSDVHPSQLHVSPLLANRPSATFTDADSCVLHHITLPRQHPLTAFIRAGPRRRVVFPPGVRAAIVSCGGLCPGINTVIRELTLALYTYGARAVFGVRNGYRGFYQYPWTDVSAESVEGIHRVGGSLLGSSRGGFDLTQIVDAIETRAIDMVFVIGGDGTIMGCDRVFREVVRRRLRCAVVSVPKTIDNDIAVIDKSFGFDTAVDEAQRSINAAYVEATSFPDCIGVVKLMGRNSGFIACHAAYASRVVDICLIPEEAFRLRGRGGVLEHIEHLLDHKGHCVVVIAEGAGDSAVGMKDIGLHVNEEIRRYFKERGREINSKYLDPTYQIRAIPTTTQDNMLCTLIAHAAVHGAFAGYTGFSAGPVNGKMALIPLHLLAGIQQKMDTNGTMWQRLRMSTGQPSWAQAE